MLYAGPVCLIGSKLNGHAKSEKLRPLRYTLGIQYTLRLNDTVLGVFIVYVRLQLLISNQLSLRT